MTSTRMHVLLFSPASYQGPAEDQEPHKHVSGSCYFLCRRTTKIQSSSSRRFEYSGTEYKWKVSHNTKDLHVSSSVAPRLVDSHQCF
jgi:hypothetical protein